METNETTSKSQEEKQPVSTPPQKKKAKKKGVIAGSIIAVVVVLLLGGGALAYNMWYQNADKVVHDAMVNAIKAKTIQATGNIVVKSDNTTVTIDVDGQSTTVDGLVNVSAKIDAGQGSGAMSIDIKGSGMYKDDTLYVKFDGVQKVVDTFVAQYPMLDAQALAQIEQIVSKIDGQWISIQPSDYEEMSKQVADQQKCVTDAVKRLSENKDATNELVDVYKQNQVVEVKEELGAKDGSLGYVVGFNKERAAAIAEALDDTTYGKELKECDDSIDFKAAAEDIKKAKDSENPPRVELWASRFGHNITTVSLTQKDDKSSVDMKLEPEFNKNVSVEAPEDVVSLKDLMADIEKLVQSYQPATPRAAY